METRLQAVELKLMDMELAMEQLNQVIIRHERTIDSLKSKLGQCEDQLQTMNSPIAPTSEETAPPHY